MSEKQSPFFPAPPNAERLDHAERFRGLKLTYSYSPDLIELDTVWHDGHGNHYDVAHEVVRLKDRAVRDALIRLGWTPPPDERRNNDPEER